MKPKHTGLFNWIVPGNVQEDGATDKRETAVRPAVSEKPKSNKKKGRKKK
jgi:hypothetical protein